jgi:hypothetical protein
MARRICSGRLRVGAVALLGALALAATAFSGCGGGTDETVVVLSKAEYVKRSDLICQKGRDNRDAAVDEATKGLSKNSGFPEGKELEELVDGTMPVLRTMAEELEAIAPPEGDEDLVAPVAAGFLEYADFAEENPEEAVEKAGPMLEEARQAARAYGMKICAKF